jgi:hypothetical protein
MDLGKLRDAERCLLSGVPPKVCAALSARNGSEVP